MFLKFSYVSAAGEITRRGIVCHKAWSTRGSIYVRGICTLRNDHRSFRADRIEHLHEVRTGRAIPDPVAYLSLYADEEEDIWDQRRRASVEAEERAIRYSRGHHAATKLCREGLKILAFVALADGDRSSSEQTVIADYIRARIEPLQLGEFSAEIEAELAAFAAALAPVRSSFTRAINKIVSDEDHIYLVFQSAVQLAKADGQSAAEEVSAVAAIVKATRAYVAMRGTADGQPVA